MGSVTVNIVRAFVDEEGQWGNPTGIIIDENQNITTVDRQKIATKLHFTDTVFINNLNPINVSFFNPEQETKFAGDSLISTAYFIRHIVGKDSNLIVCKGGQIKTWEDNGLTWIEASLEGTPPWIHKQLESAKAVEDITPDEAAKFEHTMVWAWDDKANGLIRSRTFLPDWGTLEDQGNGSGSMQLAKITGQKLKIHQGFGSIIYSCPSGENSAKVGGRVKICETRVINI